MLVNKSFSAIIIAVLLTLQFPSMLQAANLKDLKITSPSPQFKLLIYSEEILHLFYFGGKTYASSIVLAEFTPKRKILFNKTIYKAPADSTLTGINVVSVRDGYLVTFLEINKLKGETRLQLLRLITAASPVGGVGPVGKKTIKASSVNNLAKRIELGLGGVDTNPVGETSIFGITKASKNSPSRRFGAVGVVSLADSGGRRSLRLMAASFTAGYGNVNNIKKVRERDYTKSFADLTNVLPEGNGSAGVVKDSAFWFFGANSSNGLQPQIPVESWLGKMTIWNLKKFPKKAIVENGKFTWNPESPNKIIDSFGGFASNRSRGFYSSVRFTSLDGQTRTPVFLLGWEVLENSSLVNRQYIELEVPSVRKKSTSDIIQDFKVGALIPATKDRFISSCVYSQKYTYRGKTLYDDMYSVILWSLKNPPKEIYRKPLPLGYQMFQSNITRFRILDKPLYAVCSWFDHKRGDVDSSGAMYGFSFAVIKIK